MIIEIDKNVADAIKADCRPAPTLNPEYVIARCWESGEEFCLPLKVSEVEKAVSFVVTDNEGDNEVGCVRCDTLGEAVNAMVNGVADKTEVTFYCELCVDYGSCIEGVARWCHPSFYDDGAQWN